MLYCIERPGHWIPGKHDTAIGTSCRDVKELRCRQLGYDLGDLRHEFLDGERFGQDGIDAGVVGLDALLLSCISGHGDNG